MPVTLEVNGTRYGGWERIRIERTMEALSGAFTLGVTEKWPDQDTARSINPGDKCLVRIDNDIVVTGYVDDVDPALDANSHDIEVTGRDNTLDLVDCSAIHNPSQWNGQKLEKIVRDLIAPFAGIKLITKVDTGEPFKKFCLEQGETVYEAITRMCKLRAVLAYSDGHGNLILSTAGKERNGAALIHGQNIKGISGKFSQKERYSEVHVKSQTQGNDNDKPSVTTGWKGNAKDSEIKRYRPLLVIAENQANGKQCQERAAWEVATRKGKGTRITVTVQGWRQGPKSTDPLWNINSLVYVQAPSHKLKETLLICGVVFTKEESGGTETELTLVKPDAFKLIREPEPKS